MDTRSILLIAAGLFAVVAFRAELWGLVKLPVSLFADKDTPAPAPVSAEVDVEAADIHVLVDAYRTVRPKLSKAEATQAWARLEPDGPLLQEAPKP